MISIHNMRRFFNKNIRNIASAIFLIVFIIGGIQIFNYIAKEEKQNKVVTEIEKNKYVEQKKSHSVLTEEKINEDSANKNINIINEFVNFCNEGKIEDAYKLISEDCKDIYYPSIEDFKKYYYENIFVSEKVVDMQMWLTNDSKTTYRIELSEDILSAGKYEKDNYIEDYYTIVRDENKEKKININSFIYKSSIDKTVKKNNIEINCIDKEVYKEYEIYNFEVSNNTNEKIKLDSRQSSETVYLEGENSARYTAFMHELSDYDLEINPGKSKEIKIKFNKFYNPDIEINKIIFKDIILNYNENEEENMSINISIK